MNMIVRIIIINKLFNDTINMSSNNNDKCNKNKDLLIFIFIDWN